MFFVFFCLCFFFSSRERFGAPTVSFSLLVLSTPLFFPSLSLSPKSVSNHGRPGGGRLSREAGRAGASDACRWERKRERAATTEGTTMTTRAREDEPKKRKKLHRRRRRPSPPASVNGDDDGFSFLFLLFFLAFSNTFVVSVSR